MLGASWAGKRGVCIGSDETVCRLSARLTSRSGNCSSARCFSFRYLCAPRQGASATVAGIRAQPQPASPPERQGRASQPEGSPEQAGGPLKRRAGLWSGGWPHRLLRGAGALLNALLGCKPISPGVFPPNRPVVDTRSCSSSGASGGGLGGAFFCNDFSHFVSCHATPQTGDRSAGHATKQARRHPASHPRRAVARGPAAP